MKKKKENIKNTTKKALVCGSLVYDTLFEVLNPIRSQIQIENGRPSKQNLMFTGKAKQVYFGGMAGNISYGLGALGSSAIVASVAGKDFKEYSDHLTFSGAILRIHIDQNGYTPMYYGVTDPEKNQLGIFQPNCYYKHLDIPLTKLLKNEDWKSINVGIFSPGNAKSILQHSTEFRSRTGKNTFVIIDPGQMLAVDFTKPILSKILKNADMLILNDTEAHYLKTKLKVTHDNLWKFGLRYFIITKGEKGSDLHFKGGVVEVPAVKVKKVIDPTGAGDAYRAGLIHGILQGKTVAQSMIIASKLGAKCVGHIGGQTYR